METCTINRCLGGIIDFGRSHELPKQETFFKKTAEGRHIEVIKTYDRAYAQEVFRSMDSNAISTLAAALDIGSNYAPADIPDPDGSEYEDFLWDELLEAGIEDVRLDPNLRSFFVVSQNANGKSEDLYVSGDWPARRPSRKR